MSVSEFLKNLPTHNRDNFTRLQTDSPSHRQSSTRHRSTVYVPTKDIPSEQVIVTEKTNILLRYLHQQWDKKAAQTAQKKRDGDDNDGSPNVPPRKKTRLDPLPNGSNTSAGSSGGSGGFQRSAMF